ncbi:uncharacterized protein LOC135488537 isoform X2 [Lineus longissimus]
MNALDDQLQLTFLVTCYDGPGAVMTDNVDLPMLIENGLGAPQTEVTNLGRKGNKFPLNMTAEEFHIALLALFPAINLNGINYQICRAGVSKRLIPLTGRTPGELKLEFSNRSSKNIHLVPERKITSIPDSLLYRNNRRTAIPVNEVGVTPQPEPQAHAHPDPQVGVQDDLLLNPLTVCPICHRTDVTALGCQFCLSQQAYEQSLGMDCAREQRAIREDEQFREARELLNRQDQIRSERIRRSSAFIEPTIQEGFSLRIRTDTGCLTRRFRKSDSLSHLMDFIGCEDAATSQFYVACIQKKIFCCEENAGKTLAYFGITQSEVLNVCWVDDEIPPPAPLPEVVISETPDSQNEPIAIEYIPSVILRPLPRTSALHAADFVSAVAYDHMEVPLPEMRVIGLLNRPHWILVVVPLVM